MNTFSETVCLVVSCERQSTMAAVFTDGYTSMPVTLGSPILLITVACPTPLFDKKQMFQK